MKKKRKPSQPVFKEYNQDQMWLLPPSLEEMIPNNHVVRTVNVAINRMDLKQILKGYKGGGTSSYHPQMLLKVLVYAYSQKVYSSRMIAKALRENIHFMWLSGNNRPDFRTINRFRSVILKENIEKVFSSIIEMLLEKGFVKFENYFLDGTKIEADANKYSFVWGKSTQKYKTKLQQNIHDLLEHIEKENENENREYGDKDLEELGEGIEITSEDLEKTIKEINDHLNEIDDEKSKDQERNLKKLKEDYLSRLQKYEKQQQILGKRNSYSKTDHDATFMRMKEDPMRNGQLKAGYNVQIGTENQFILGYSIHQKPTDTTTLIPHMKRVEEITGMVPENLIADAGYGSEENYAFIESKKMGNYVKHPYFYRNQKKKFRKNIFHTENLAYDPVDDEFTCPTGMKLKYIKERIRVTENGYTQKIKIYQAEDCRWCRKREQCHKSRYDRRIEINPILNTYKTEANENLHSEKGSYLRKKRSVEVESVFGHIKHNRGFKRFLLRGLTKVSTEWGLLSVAHNLFKMNLAMS
jgi:transposase